MFELDIFTSPSHRRPLPNDFFYTCFNPVKTIRISKLFGGYAKDSDAFVFIPKLLIATVVTKYSNTQFELSLVSLKSFTVLKQTRVYIGGGSINRKVIIKHQSKASTLLLYHESMRRIELRYFFLSNLSFLSPSVSRT